MLKVEDLIHTPLLFSMFWQEKYVHKILSQMKWVIYFITLSSRHPRKLDWKMQWGSEWLLDLLGSAPPNLNAGWETRTEGAETSPTLWVCWGMLGWVLRSTVKFTVQRHRLVKDRDQIRDLWNASLPHESPVCSSCFYSVHWFWLSRENYKPY